MGVFSPPITTRLALKWVSLGITLLFLLQWAPWVSLGVTLLFLLQWGAPTVDAREGMMYGEILQQQRSCDPGRLSQCRDYLQRRREQPPERCCEELERMSPQCRCRAIQQVLHQSQSYDSTMGDLFMDSEAAHNQRRRHRESRGREEEEAEERTAYLPETCNVCQPPHRCDVQHHSRYFATGSSF